MNRVSLILAGVLVACDGRSATPTPGVAIEGYGIRLRLTPPFKAGRAPVGPAGRADQFIVAHEGRDGLRNLFVTPSVSSAATREIHPVSTPMPGLQLGTDGTQVLFGVGMTSLDGVGALEPGSNAPSWTIVAGTRTTAWPVGKIVQSTDAPTAAGFQMVDVPVKP